MAPGSVLFDACRTVEAAIDQVDDAAALQDALRDLREIQAKASKKMDDMQKTVGREITSHEEPQRERLVEQLKKNFKHVDSSGNGKLNFMEFYAMLRNLRRDYCQSEAMHLFTNGDNDGSGTIDFEEFVDYVFGHDDCAKLLKYEPKNHREEEAKKKVLARPMETRQAAQQAVHDEGQEWFDLSWQERLEEIKEYEDAQEEEAEAEAAAAKPKPTKHRPLKNMSQEELVLYSIQEDDMKFAASSEAALADLAGLKASLATAGSFSEDFYIHHFLGKGTEGWVFQAKHKGSETVHAIKVVRMTMVRTSLREWIVSKMLRGFGIQNIVFTDEKIYVLPKESAPGVVKEKINNAGPAPFFACLVQEFMEKGSLEDLRGAGELTPQLLFKGLEDVAKTLAAMHANHVQHRDVKPENMLAQAQDGGIVAKLSDFGSAELGDCAEGRADDVRRFGITIFALVTGEGWQRNRLITARAQDLLTRMAAAVEGCPPEMPLSRLPGVLREILVDCPSMDRVAAMMSELKNAFVA